MINLPLQPFPQLKTSRLLLRRLQMPDAKEIYLLRADDRVNQYIDRPKALHMDDAFQYIEKIDNGVKAGEWVYWAIQLRGTSKLIGTICLWNFANRDGKAELGYELMPEHQGKGIMREAVQAVLQYGFSTLQLKCIEAVSRTGNLRSIKLLEEFGFVLDKTSVETEAASRLVTYIVQQA